MNLPKQDSATGRSLKTSAQAGIGTVVATAVVQLVTDVWNVPGVPDVVIKNLQENIVVFAGIIGLSSGITAFIWNLFRKRVATY